MSNYDNKIAQMQRDILELNHQVHQLRKMLGMERLAEEGRGDHNLIAKAEYKGVEGVKVIRVSDDELRANHWKYPMYKVEVDGVFYYQATKNVTDERIAFIEQSGKVMTTTAADGRKWFK